MDYTTICEVSNQYSQWSANVVILATSTESCYSPLRVQVFYLIDFLFFAVVFIVAIWLVNKIFNA